MSEAAKKETISCAMTTWNSDENLELQLESLRLQARPFDEVVIVDDASENDTVERIQTFIQTHELKNWKLIEHETNQGFIRSFQDALQACTKDIIFLCDHDDLWYRCKTSRMMEQFEIWKDDLKVLACSFDMIDARGQKIEHAASAKKGNHNLIRRPIEAGQLNVMHFDDLAAYNIAPGCTLALRHETARLYLDLARDLDLPHDWAVSAIAALQDGLAYLDRPLMGYRQHDHNTLGLARRTGYEDRLEGARKDARYKASLLKLTERMSASREDLALMRTISQVFRERCDALDEQNLFSLSQLLFSPVGQGFRKTIGMDITTLLRRRGDQ